MSTAIILAGGLGTRLQSTVPDLPKPMAPINGRPFLEILMDYWINQGIKRFILSVGYLHEIIIHHFGEHYKKIPIEYVIEKNPLGTGGGLLLTVERFLNNESFLLLNGDTYFESKLYDLIQFSINNDADWCFSLFNKKEQYRYMGIDVSEQGKIKSFNDDLSHLINGGVYWVNSRTFNDNFNVGDKFSLEDDFFPEILTSNQRLFGIEFSSTFIDIGIPNDYQYAQQLLKRKVF